MGICNALGDIVLVVLPFPILRKVQLSRRNYVRLSLLFGIGFFLVVITILRLPLIVNDSLSQNARSLWASIEMLCACIVANTAFFYSVLRDMEGPFVAPPWWQGPQTYIEDTAEGARKKHLALLRQEKAALHIYTDGSGINGQIGAAAVCPTIQQTRSSYMGTEDVSTVYAGELQGISLALDIAQRDRAEGYRLSKVVIYTDNQAAIRSSARPKGKSGAYLLKKIVAQITTLQEQNFRWIPAHTGV
ncbi:ebs-bah-phd domain-containing protein [Purpureocillium lavendulum]|uniref:Ebs-bah-phd domain-containing protein n=1 Tax=Purpureocillium lavendulum TaxID=1247861 RepID=A0AB34FF24_9HYPO|nr:ebs-bah-phd domain-containing protein [Purpureocillium lavendulum]